MFTIENLNFNSTSKEKGRSSNNQLAVGATSQIRPIHIEMCFILPAFAL